MRKIQFMPNPTTATFSKRPRQIIPRNELVALDEDYAKILLATQKSLALGGMYLDVKNASLSPIVTLLNLNNGRIYGWTLKKKPNISYFEYFDNTRTDCNNHMLCLANITSFFLAEVHDICCAPDIDSTILNNIGNYILAHMS